MRNAVMLVVSLAIVAAGFAGEAGGHRQAQARSLGTIEVIAVAHRMELPAPPVGREGNGEMLRWSIRDRFGRSIGRGLIACRWQLAQARLCTGEISFPLGKLAVIGASQTRSLGEWSVVGGTGRYEGANGAMTFRATGLSRLTLVITI